MRELASDTANVSMLTDPPPSGCCRTFPATPEHVGQARRALAVLLDGSSLTEDATVCLSELVTNSIEHSNSRQPGGQFTVCATLAGGWLRVEVEDQGGLWLPRPQGTDGPRGRGLRIVEALSLAWGRSGGGTGSRTVWFEMHEDPNGSLGPWRSA
ncbi:MAG TPA: ATP-binding protein [Streptosporangiaceae bacterium]|nr:ATP-binding protein [Streptosporangiaceae bacterium]